MVEEDGISVGLVRLIKFAEDTPIFTFLKERIDAADEENKVVTYKVIDGVLAGFYKYFEATLAVTPERYGAVVKWNVEYEKVNEEVPEPKLMQEFVFEAVNDLGSYLAKA